MNSKVTLNYFYNLIYQVLSIALPVLTVPYVSRVLGAGSLGQYYYVNSIVTYFGIVVATGTVDFGQREIAKRQDDILKRSKLFWEILNFRLICTCVATVVYLMFIVCCVPRYQSLYFINLITFLSWVVDVSWYLQGMENFRATAIRNGAVKLLATVLIFVFIKKPGDIYIYVLIYAVAGLFGNLTMIPYLKKQIRYCRVSFKDILSNFGGIMGLFIPVIAVQLYTSLNQTMLGLYSSSDEVGYYSQVLSVVNLIITIITAYSTVLVPHVTFLYVKKQLEKVHNYFKQAINYVYMMAIPLLIGFIMLDYNFVPLFFGQKYKPAIPIMTILCILFVVLGLSRLLGAILISIDRQHYYTISVITAALVNIILNLIFLAKFNMGAYGVAIATVVSECTTTIIDIVCLSDLMKFEQYFKSLIRYLIISLPIVFIILICRMFIQGTIIAMASSILLSIIYYAAILLAIKDEFFINLITPFINRL